jgi:small subunit ribosomal protein S7
MNFVTITNRLLNKVISRVMVHGKRSKAENLLNKAIRQMGEDVKKIKEKDEDQDQELLKFKVRHGLLQVEAFLHVLILLCPGVEIKSVRRGAGSFQVPFPLTKNRQLYKGISWLVEGARRRRKRTGVSFEKALGRELFEAYNGRGWAVRQRNYLTKRVKRRRAFINFRW